MLILLGASASGKTVIARYLATHYKITKIVTYTTRNPRINEVDGVDYNFVSIEKFNELAMNGFFVETTFYNGNYYGTAKKDIQDNKCVVLDPNGLKSFLALDDKRIFSVYLDCDEKTRFKRMIERKDDIESVNKRLVNDAISFNPSNLRGVDYTINSSKDGIERLGNEIYKIYKEHLDNL